MEQQWGDEERGKVAEGGLWSWGQDSEWERSRDSLLGSNSREGHEMDSMAAPYESFGGVSEWAWLNV